MTQEHTAPPSKNKTVFGTRVKILKITVFKYVKLYCPRNVMKKMHQFRKEHTRNAGTEIYVPYFQISVSATEKQKNEHELQKGDYVSPLFRQTK